jgi:hypothetical protein
MTAKIEITKITCDCGAEFTFLESYKIHRFYNHPPVGNEQL